MPEMKILTKNCGVIDPADLDAYVQNGGFSALGKAREMTPEQVIGIITASGLRGRGGAGFPTGLKWSFARQAPGDEKFLICNADEGEVGAFKDRFLIAGDPFSLIEGIGIAAHAMGAGQAFIYLRAEYHYLLGGLVSAISQARAKGWLGDLSISVVEGAGAYICGEESALMNSMEGRRGESRFKPPFPPQEGLWRKPTVINNVETLCATPHIILNGADWWAGMGSGRSRGVKLFSVSGDASKPGVYEMPLGSPLAELLDLAEARDVKFVQVGGSAGHLIPAGELDAPLSFEGVLGAGAVTVFNQSRDVVSMVWRTIQFLAEESCGKCAPCREGSEVMVEILSRLVAGEGRETDLSALEDVAAGMGLSSLCGLGQAAATPVMDGLGKFRDEFEAHISQAVYLRGLKSLGA